MQSNKTGEKKRREIIMDETPKIHHHKSKHRKSSSSRRTITENNNISDVKDKELTAVDIEDSASSKDVPINAATTATTTEAVVEINAPQNAAIEIADGKKTGHDEGASNSIEVTSIVDGVAPATTEDRQIHKGILGYMDREIKSHRKPPQSLSDPTASPAQRSIRSRSSIEKSPRQKRSKSESRRRRERKLIAAGELEVKQANETLMRYLKQCSEINDASLSGELEIDKSIDDRRVHRKTKSQRGKRIHGGGGSGSVGGSGGSGIGGINAKSSGSSFVRDRLPPSGLTSILQELASDVVSHGEIYNPFTPVISPTDGASRTDRMFIQTPHGFRSVSDSTFFKESMHGDEENNRYKKKPFAHIKINK